MGSSPGLFFEGFIGHCSAAQFVKQIAGVGMEIDFRFLQQQSQTTAHGEIWISAGFLNHLVVNLVAFLCEI